MSKLNELLPRSKIQDSVVPQQQMRRELQHQQLETGALTELREDFRKKLLIFDKQFFELCERNDWLQNLKKSSEKQLEWSNGE